MEVLRSSRISVVVTGLAGIWAVRERGESNGSYFPLEYLQCCHSLGLGKSRAGIKWGNRILDLDLGR